MKRRALFLLLSVSLLFAGCGEENGQIVAVETGVETEDVEPEVMAARENPGGMEPDETEGTGETELPEGKTGTGNFSETETALSVKKTSEEKREARAGAEQEIKKQEPAGRKAETQMQAGPEEKTGPEAPVQTEHVRTETPTQPQPAVPETEKATELAPEPQPVQEPKPVSYSPGRVAELATAKTKACGKIYIPDDLNRMLSEGSITEEDYHACYPTDGAGYLEYYVASDLNEARDVSGTVKFGSEEDIAANIAGMYSALPQQYFYIEYHGTAVYGGKECYVFYCYRA